MDQLGSLMFKFVSKDWAAKFAEWIFNGFCKLRNCADLGNLANFNCAFAQCALLLGSLPMATGYAFFGVFFALLRADIARDFYSDCLEDKT